MKKNIGKIDRVIRLLLGLFAVILYFMGVISGIAALFSGVIAIICVITSFISFSPIYHTLKISTRRKEEKE